MAKSACEDIDKEQMSPPSAAVSDRRRAQPTPMTFAARAHKRRFKTTTRRPCSYLSHLRPTSVPSLSYIVPPSSYLCPIFVPSVPISSPYCPLTVPLLSPFRPERRCFVPFQSPICPPDRPPAGRMVEDPLLGPNLSVIFGGLRP